MLMVARLARLVIALWLLTGMVSVGVIAKVVDVEPDEPVEPMTFSRTILVLWALVLLVVMGPIGLHATLEWRKDKRVEAAARRPTTEKRDT